MNHRQPLSKFVMSIYVVTVPHYHRWDDLLLNTSFDERFAFKETKNDLNPTILAATAIKCVGDQPQLPPEKFKRPKGRSESERNGWA